MSFSPCIRGRISSPLEAGPSIADGHQLPNNVNQALEYASKRLRRKAAHITLLVVRRDYQIPTSPISSPTFTPSPRLVSAGSTPSRSTFPTSRIEALKQLVRPSNSGEGQIRERIVHVHLDQLRNATVSPAFSEASAFSASTASSASTSDSTFSRRIRWPGSPTAYGSVPVTPATPFTAMSSLSGAEGNGAGSRLGAQNSTQFGLKLVYAHPLSPREEKGLTQALEKAAKKFKLDPRWLPQAVSPSAFGLPADLILKSSAQNKTLFTSERLTLLSLDHLYTFRAALQAYARTRATARLEDAVDELRRLFLANGRRALRKSTLLGAYRWLDPLNDVALADVCRMYERAYGGIERESGVENDVDPTPGWPLPERQRISVLTEQSITKGTRISARHSRQTESAPPPQRREPEIKTQIVDLANALDKEILLSSNPLPEDQSELDEIEAWYREIQQQQNDVPSETTIEIHPLRSHPAEDAPAVVEILPLPSSPPPPPPTSATYRNRPWHQPEEPTLSEMLRTTPKLRPAPPGRSLALKLQTTFVKPTRGSGGGGKTQILKPVATKPQAQTTTEPAIEPVQEEDGDEEEEELTARPHSAVKSFANARWATSHGGANGGMSIDELMLHGGAADGEGGRESGSHLQVQPQGDDRVGPMTPNGYDDISPITRGEWGFLMFGKGKTAGIGTC